MEDYKQKYEQALERAKVVNPGTTDYNIVTKIFPELKESEDIGKRLIKSIEGSAQFTSCLQKHGFVREDILAWLEKQCSIGKINEKLRQYREYLIKETESWNKKEEDETLSKIGKQDCIGHANAYISARSKFEDLFNYDSWLEKQGEQKSEEVDNLHNYLYDEQNPADEVGNYDHKKVLQTIINEQKPAWSEEDDKILQTLINDTEKTLFAIKQEERYDIMSGLSEIYIERLRWLKSLKERYTWKPSDEQINTLEQWLKDNRYNGNARYCYPIFDSLCQDLKKLRKE